MTGITDEAHVSLREIPLQHYTTMSAEQEKTVNVLVRHNSDGSLIAPEEPRTHRPTFWQQFPWSGVGPLLGVIACSICCVVVIGTSDNVPKSTWKLRAAPNVLVNILTAISGILVTMAVAQGMSISWWRRALSGTSVEDLHYSWQFSASMLSLFKGWRFWNGMALTALCTKFAIVDSTLFQKALSTRSALGPSTQIQVPIYPTETFPPTGTLNKYGNDTAAMSFAATFDVLDWTMSSNGINAEYLNGFYQCGGLCGLNYRSIGFESICTQTNVSASRNQEAVDSGTLNSDLMFSVSFEHRWPTPEQNYSYINMEWVYWIDNFWDNSVANPTCGGRLVNLSCELRPSIVDYPISTRNSSYSELSAKSKDSEFFVYLGPLNDTAGTIEGIYLMTDYTIDRQLPNFTVVNNIDVYEQQIPGGNTSLGGIAYALQQYYGSTSTVAYDNTTTVNPSTGKSQDSIQAILTTNGILASVSQDASTGTTCPLSFSADYDSMLNGINTLMVMISDDVFGRANYSGPWGAYSSDFYGNYTADVVRYANATQFQDETYYVSHMGFAWGAFASTMVVVVLILPSYWKFWELGRRVTMGPIDIIDALKSPAFSHLLDGNGSGNGGVQRGVGEKGLGMYSPTSDHEDGTLPGSKRQSGDHV